MMQRAPKRSDPLRRILWIASPLAVSLLLLFDVHSMFAVKLAGTTPLSPEVPHFQFEQQAQQRCPDDSVVWAIARLDIYYSNTERWYGQTSDGTSTCLRDVEMAGYHAARITR